MASVGEKKIRVDAYEKAAGRARYTDDLCGQEALVPFPPREDRLLYCMDCYLQIQAERREQRAERERG